MNRYRQLTSEERHTLSTLRKQGYRHAAIARALGRHRSTISREVRRNSKDRQGRVCRPDPADDTARWRRGRSRRNERFGPSDWRMVERCLRQQWSPEQVSGWLRRMGQLSISHETIYRHIWRDRKTGSRLYLHLRCSPKQRRKRYGRYDSRGRLAGKRPISERPAGAQNRSRVGHLEADTVIGTSSDKHCVLTFVDRKSGYVMIGKLEARTVEATNRRAVRMIKNAARTTHTVTADNGTEFHGYKAIEAATGSKFFFATPYHSWERGDQREHERPDPSVSAEAPELAHVTQRHCSRIAQKLNNRPRKRLGFLTPKDCYELNSTTYVLCSQSLFRFADLGDDGLCRGGPDKGCGVIVSAIDVVVDRLD